MTLRCSSLFRILFFVLVGILFGSVNVISIVVDASASASGLDAGVLYPAYQDELLNDVPRETLKESISMNAIDKKGSRQGRRRTDSITNTPSTSSLSSSSSPFPSATPYPTMGTLSPLNVPFSTPIFVSSTSVSVTSSPTVTGVPMSFRPTVYSDTDKTSSPQVTLPSSNQPSVYMVTSANPTMICTSTVSHVSMQPSPRRTTSSPSSSNTEGTNSPVIRRLPTPSPVAVTTVPVLVPVPSVPTIPTYPVQPTLSPAVDPPSSGTPAAVEGEDPRSKIPTKTPNNRIPSSVRLSSRLPVLVSAAPMYGITVQLRPPTLAPQNDDIEQSYDEPTATPIKQGVPSYNNSDGDDDNTFVTQSPVVAKQSTPSMIRTRQPIQDSVAPVRGQSIRPPTRVQQPMPSVMRTPTVAPTREPTTEVTEKDNAPTAPTRIPVGTTTPSSSTTNDVGTLIPSSKGSAVFQLPDGTPSIADETPTLTTPTSNDDDEESSPSTSWEYQQRPVLVTISNIDITFENVENLITDIRGQDELLLPEVDVRILESITKFWFEQYYSENSDSGDSGDKANNGNGTTTISRSSSKYDNRFRLLQSTHRMVIDTELESDESTTNKVNTVTNVTVEIHFFRQKVVASASNASIPTRKTVFTFNQTLSYFETKINDKSSSWLKPIDVFLSPFKVIESNRLYGTLLQERLPVYFKNVTIPLAIPEVRNISSTNDIDSEPDNPGTTETSSGESVMSPILVVALIVVIILLIVAGYLGFNFIRMIFLSRRSSGPSDHVPGLTRSDSYGCDGVVINNNNIGTASSNNNMGSLYPDCPDETGSYMTEDSYSVDLTGQQKLPDERNQHRHHHHHQKQQHQIGDAHKTQEHEQAAGNNRSCHHDGSVNIHIDNSLPYQKQVETAASHPSILDKSGTASFLSPQNNYRCDNYGRQSTDLKNDFDYESAALGMPSYFCDSGGNVAQNNYVENYSRQDKTATTLIVASVNVAPAMELHQDGNLKNVFMDKPCIYNHFAGEVSGHSNNIGNLNEDPVVHVLNTDYDRNDESISIDDKVIVLNDCIDTDSLESGYSNSMVGEEDEGCCINNTNSGLNMRRDGRRSFTAEEFVHIFVPSGCLNVTLSKPDDGPPMIIEVNNDSLLMDYGIYVGDRIMAVDDIDTWDMPLDKVSVLLHQNSYNDDDDVNGIGGVLSVCKITVYRIRRRIADDDDIEDEFDDGEARFHSDECSELTGSFEGIV